MVTNGSAVAITPDGKVALAVNRTADSISLFQTDFSGTTPTVTKMIELNTLVGAEPWSVVVGNDGDTAYAIYRKAQLAVKITNLHAQGGQPAITQTAKTGSEPTGIAISPSGQRLYVANWAEGTVTVVKTADMSVLSTVDLNASLAGTGFLGSGLQGRPGLAHPRALVVTNGGTGNDSAETVYVTEFFSQPITSGVPTDDTLFDVGRQGVVYRFNAGKGYALAAPIPIAPVAATGFLDSDGNKTGCFPNQLYAAALNDGRLYVTSVCASPRGPVNVVAGTPVNTNNVKTEVHASVFVIDTATNAELPAQGLRLTQQFEAAFNTLADAGVSVANRFPLIPNDIAFKPGTNVGYVTALGSDAVYRIAYNADGSLKQVGSTTQPFIDLETPTLGQLPYGIAIEPKGSFALAINETQRNLSVLQFTSQTALTAVSSSAAPGAGTPEAQVNNGHRLFATGVARWSLNGASWNSCEGCHAEGLTDGVTWFFARGPRQTLSLDGTFGPNGEQRILNWTGIFDEMHDFELNARGNSGGVGAIVVTNETPPKAADRIIFDGTTAVAPQVATQTRQDGLNGSTRAMMPGNAGVPAADGTTVNSVLGNWDDIEAYVKQLRSPKAPTNLAAADVTAGAQLFAQNGCAGCHGTAAWTISKLFYTPGDANNGPGGALTTQTWVRPSPGNPSGTTGTFPASLAPGIPPFPFRAPATFDPANDQITCVLRNVGTYDTAPNGVVVKEVRANGANGAGSMSVTAQGAGGFNPPALIGMAIGAPYFHAGNARTLEESFDGVFVSHHAAFSANFLANSDPAQIRQIVAYLLSIDDSTTPVDPPNAALGFDPILCNQFSGQ
jgi:6-phosphogluconolactonase (cycloisomerase 2 family)